MSDNPFEFSEDELANLEAPEEAKVDTPIRADQTVKEVMPYHLNK